jgi:hypothetical protein
MTTPKQLQTFFDQPRNGCDGYIRHPLARNFIYTSGIKELCVFASCFWMLDVIGTEAVPRLLKDFRDNDNVHGIIKFNVDLTQGLFLMTMRDGEPPIWVRDIEYTDFPSGTWTLYLAVDQVIEPGQTRVVLYLPSEY